MWVGAADPEPLLSFLRAGDKYQDLDDALETLNRKTGVPSSAHVPELRRLGLSGSKGPLEVILSRPAPLLKEGHLAALGQRLRAEA